MVYFHISMLLLLGFAYILVLPSICCLAIFWIYYVWCWLGISSFNVVLHWMIHPQAFLEMDHDHKTSFVCVCVFACLSLYFLIYRMHYLDRLDDDKTDY